MLKYFREMGMRKILTAGKFLTILPHSFDSRNKIDNIYVLKKSVFIPTNKVVLKNVDLYVYCGCCFD